MKFDQYLRLSSTLLILTGFYAILITGSYTVSVVFGIATALAYWALGERLSGLFPVPKWFWNGVALCLLAYLAYDSFFKSLDLVGNGIKFVVYLQTVKLLSPKTNRDQLQIYLLSFLHILASTVISTDISFSIPFLIYIVLATWTLAMFNLKLQLETSASPEKRAASVSWLLQSKNIITRNFLWLTSILSLTIIAFTLLVFFSFPRVSMGNFLKRVDVRRNESGFSDQVTLGTIGNIKLNNAIALRVEIEKSQFDTIDFDHLYWRGSASDAFDGRTWKQSYEDRFPLRLDTENPTMEIERPLDWKGQEFSYRVFMEGMNPPILFGADRLIGVSWDKPMIERIFRGSLGLQRDLYSGFYFAGANVFAADLTYSATSSLGPPPQNVLEKDEKTIPRFIAQDYLQLPELHPDVEQLFRSIPLPGGSLYEKARALTSYFENNYKYTLSVQDTGTQDPLRFFLIEQKKGHCEYFSTALAIAFRFHGIPARNVVGYRGGEPNPYGSYIAVRQSDAHSWVEAYFPAVGWVRFDPSPLDSTVSARRSMFRAVNQFVDYLRLRWNKYILEYDLRSQAQLVENLLKRFSKWGKGKDKAIQDEDEKEKPRTQIPTWVLGGLLCLLAVALVFAWIRKSKEGAHRRHYGLFWMVLKMVRRYRFEKIPSETVLEFVRRIEERTGPLPVLTKLAEMYYIERFGRRRLDPGLWQERIQELEQALKSKRPDGRGKNPPAAWRRAA
jgi:protein-glutamine gamma-glutamyltransferase